MFFLAKNADTTIQNQLKASDTLNKKELYKRTLGLAYDNYAKTYKLSWNKPKYYVPNKLPKIPLESKIEMLIANASKKLALAISISRDTEMRPIEYIQVALVVTLHIFRIRKRLVLSKMLNQI